MKRLLLACLVCLSLFWPVGTARAQDTPPVLPDLADLLPPGTPLPDLQTIPPFGLQLISNGSGSRRVLRFSNSVANTGSAALELRGDMDPETLVVTLIQEVPTLTGKVAASRLGGFEYHPEHGHWHWQGFSLYEIWSLGPNARLEQAQLNSGKVGYCMMDTGRANTAWLDTLSPVNQIPIAAQAYTSCGWRRQGISPGWIDTYLRHLPGQSMDISDLTDGVYALRSVVDPEGLLVEADKSNNDSLVYFHLEGTRLTILEDIRFVRARVFQQLYGDQPFYDSEGTSLGWK